MFIHFDRNEFQAEAPGERFEEWVSVLFDCDRIARLKGRAQDHREGVLTANSESDVFWICIQSIATEPLRSCLSVDASSARGEVAKKGLKVGGGH